MSLLPDRLFSAEWVRDKRLRALGRHVQMLLIYLRHMCDRNGRFEFDPAEVHRAFYVSVEDNVSVRDVEAWLEILRSGGFIKSYVGVEGRRVGEMASEYWKQRLNFGKSHFDPEPVEGQLPLDAPPPPVPPPTRREEKRSEVNGSRKRSPAPIAPHTRTEKTLAKDSLSELTSKWPEHDVSACLKRAERYVIRERGEGAVVEAEWFSRFWMPNEPKNRARVERQVQLNEPSNFVEWFTGRYDNPPSKAWSDLTGEQRSYYLKQMGSVAVYNDRLDTCVQRMSNVTVVSGSAA